MRNADEIIAQALRGSASVQDSGHHNPALRRGQLFTAGLVGRGIGASRTPVMHVAEGARMGIAYEYRLIDFDILALTDADLTSVVAVARREGYAGLNITHPFKERVIEGLDALAPEAAAIGAVNTVTFRDGAAVGHNTDFFGFAENFRLGMPGADLGSVVLIGAGGAGMAVARVLLDTGVKDLAVADLDPVRAQRLVSRLGAGRVTSLDQIETVMKTATGLVNATPIGMAKYPGTPVDPALLRPGIWVADIVYFPAETELLAKARAIGCRTLAGAGMAVFQAVRAFEIITGLRPDAESMAGHFRSLGS